MATTEHRLPEAERAKRRRQDRERLRAATEELLSSEGGQRWVRAHQCHARGIEPRRVAGFRTWLKLGRAVRKGEKGLRIFAPMAVTERDEQGEETGEKWLFLRSAFVFADVQTAPLPGVRAGAA